MSKILRAFLISALATGAAAVLAGWMHRETHRDMRETPVPDEKPFMVDAESLTEEERQRLTDELDAML